MATEAVAVSYTSDPVRPYSRSWLDVFFDWMTALPGPTWLAWAIAFVPGILLTNSALWLSGLVPWGELDQTQIFWGVATIGIPAAAHYLKTVAGAAFDAFLPALGSGIADPDRARYEITVIPARPIWVITIVIFLATPLFWIVDPVASQTEGLSPAGFVARGLSEGLVGVVTAAILLQAIRQLRRVTRLHEVADAVDPFRPIPLYAFSRLTAQTGIVLIVFTTVGLSANPSALTSEAASGLTIAWVTPFILGSIAIFLLPLRGMHRRLEAEKDRLTGAADGRLRMLLGELNEAIDARATESVDALDRTISALRREREILATLPTWPWSTGTIRGFASALLLPIGLFLVQRALSTALGDLR